MHRVARTLQRVGTVLQPVGCMLQRVGAALQPAGILLQQAGILLLRLGSTLNVRNDPLICIHFDQRSRNMTHPNTTIAEQLNAAELAIRSSLADAEIRQLVAGCGYTIEKLGEGRLLFEVARAT